MGLHASRSSCDARCWGHTPASLKPAFRNCPLSRTIYLNNRWPSLERTWYILDGYPATNEVVGLKCSTVACSVAFWIFFAFLEQCEPYPSIQPPRALQTKGWKLRHASLEMRHVGISHHRYVPVVQIQSLPALVVQFKLNYLNLLPPNS